MSMLFAELFDALFFASLANEQDAVLFCHDAIVKSLYHHALFLCGVYDAVVRIIKFDVVSDAGIPVKVVFGLFP